MNLLIKDSNIKTVLDISNQIEEFEEPYGEEEYKNRLENVQHKILVAFDHTIPIGFKVGYAKSDQLFYSWMGGVISRYRKQGVAKALADAQENWAKQNGYQIIEMKTRNIHKRMLIFALSNGFHIKKVISKSDWRQNRIYLEKRLI